MVNNYRHRLSPTKAKRTPGAVLLGLSGFAGHNYKMDLHSFLQVSETVSYIFKWLWRTILFYKEVTHARG